MAYQPRRGPPVATLIVAGVTLAMFVAAVGLFAVRIGQQNAAVNRPAGGQPGEPAAARVQAAQPAGQSTATDRKLFDAWCRQNLGDPGSVEMILFEGPRDWGGRRVYGVKYRAVNEFGAKQVFAHYYQIESGSCREMLQWEQDFLDRVWGNLKTIP